MNQSPSRRDLSPPRTIRAALVCALLAVIAQGAHAQGVRGAMATRASLTAAAESATIAGRSEDAAAIRTRLTDGDFAVGDRVVLMVRTETVVQDTVAVRDGRMLRVSNLSDVSLQGVLRSELESHLTRELTKIVREPHVEATALVRLAILGQVVRPGYYWTNADLPLSDVIMTAGGPTASADPARTVVRRASDELIDRESVNAALARGATLDQLGLRAGDELIVGKRRERNMTATLQVAVVVVGLVVSVLTLARSR